MTFTRYVIRKSRDVWPPTGPAGIEVGTSCPSGWVIIEEDECRWSCWVSSVPICRQGGKVKGSSYITSGQDGGAVERVIHTPEGVVSVST